MVNLIQSKDDKATGEKAVRAAEVVLKIVRTLKPLTQRSRVRVLSYVADRLAEEEEQKRPAPARPPRKRKSRRSK